MHLSSAYIIDFVLHITELLLFLPPVLWKDQLKATMIYMFLLKLDHVTTSMWKESLVVMNPQRIIISQLFVSSAPQSFFQLYSVL